MPILYKQCDIPILLEDIKYCDFSNDETYLEKLKELVQDIGVVFNKSALFMDRQEPNLGEAVDLAINYNLPIFRTPFHRPFQYIGMRVSDVAKTLNITPNEAGNLIIESDECRMVLWAEGGFVGYVDISIIKTMPCCLAKEFDSAPLLGSLSINPAELDFARRKTHHHTYYDHKRKLKISVSCPDSGMPLTVAFSAKYYGD